MDEGVERGSAKVQGNDRKAKRVYIYMCLMVGEIRREKGESTRWWW